MMKIAGHIAVALLSAMMLATAGASADEIGTVNYVEVWAYGTPPQTSRLDLFQADAVETDEVVETVKGGALHVVFLDDTELRLGPASSVTLDSFVYDPSTSAGEFVADLGIGVFRVITGSLQKDAIQITTPVAVIGVRGTDFLVAVLATGTTIIQVLRGIVTITPKAGGDTSTVAANQSATMDPTGAVSAGGAVSPHGLEEVTKRHTDRNGRDKDSGD
ncbi:MAG: FecR domain-containing protein [Alphaproteobacteria bacterium]